MLVVVVVPQILSGFSPQCILKSGPLDRRFPTKLVLRYDPQAANHYLDQAVLSPQAHDSTYTPLL